MAPPRRADTDNLAKSSLPSTLGNPKPRKLVSSLRRLLSVLQGSQRSSNGSPMPSSTCDSPSPEHAKADAWPEDSRSSATADFKPAPRPITSMPQLVLPPVESNLSPSPTGAQITQSLRSKGVLSLLSASALSRVPTVLNFSTGAMSDRCCSNNATRNNMMLSSSNTSNKASALSSTTGRDNSADVGRSPYNGNFGGTGTNNNVSLSTGHAMSLEPGSPMLSGVLHELTDDPGSAFAGFSAPPNRAIPTPASVSATSATISVNITPHLPQPQRVIVAAAAAGGDVRSDRLSPTAAGSGSAPAGASPSTLLAMCPGAPESMRRPVWRLADYSISGRVYKGEVSSVYKAVCLRSNLRVALKVYSLNRVAENVVHTLVREVNLHSDLSHGSVLMMYGVFEEESRLVLVLERASRGDLLALYRSLPHCRMSEDQLRVLVLAPLLDALVYLHSRGVCHRDIKPENLLMTGGWQLKVADFGAAINLAQERAVTRTGTVDYMAPEVERCPLKARPEDNKNNPHLAYSTAADVWSLGVLSYEMLVGFPPFISGWASRQDATWAAAAGAAAAVRSPPSSRDLSFPHFLSAGAQDFIAGALVERPGDRPTAAQLMRHPWLKHALRQHQLRLLQQQGALEQCQASVVQQRSFSHAQPQQQQVPCWALQPPLPQQRPQDEKLSPPHMRSPLQAAAALEAACASPKAAPLAAPSRIRMDVDGSGGSAARPGGHAAWPRP